MLDGWTGGEQSGGYLVLTGPWTRDMDVVRRLRLYFLRSEKPVARHFFGTVSGGSSQQTGQMGEYLYQSPVPITSEHRPSSFHILRARRNPS